MWLRGEDGGKKADFSNMDLRKMNFRGEDLRGVDLKGAILHGSDFTGVNLTGVNFSGADFSGAILDYSCWPLWCGSLSVGAVDDRLALQLLAHVARLPTGGLSSEVAALITGLPELARNGFCRYRGEVKPIGGVEA
jgi:hypothetical protein